MGTTGPRPAPKPGRPQFGGEAREGRAPVRGEPSTADRGHLHPTCTDASHIGYLVRFFVSLVKRRDKLTSGPTRGFKASCMTTIQFLRPLISHILIFVANLVSGCEILLLATPHGTERLQPKIFTS